MTTLISVIILAIVLAIIVSWFVLVEWIGDKINNFNLSFYVQMFVLFLPIVVIASMLIK